MRIDVDDEPCRATAGRGSYQILYNDYEVARELNKTLKNGRVFNFIAWVTVIIIILLTVVLVIVSFFPQALPS